MHWRGPAAANAKNTELISELGGSGGMPPGKFFFDNANSANWAIFIIFVRPLGRAMAPLAPPWSRLWRGGRGWREEEQEGEAGRQQEVYVGVGWREEEEEEEVDGEGWRRMKDGEDEQWRRMKDRGGGGEGGGG